METQTLADACEPWFEDVIKRQDAKTQQLLECLVVMYTNWLADGSEVPSWNPEWTDEFNERARAYRFLSNMPVGALVGYSGISSQAIAEAYRAR